MLYSVPCDHLLLSCNLNNKPFNDKRNNKFQYLVSGLSHEFHQLAYILIPQLCVIVKDIYICRFTPARCDIVKEGNI